MIAHPIQNYDAGGVIAPHRFVKFGTGDYAVVQAAAATDAIVGISDSIGAAENARRVDVVKGGRTKLEVGGNVTRGQAVTADSDGKGVAATGAGNRYGAFAEQSGVDGDIIDVTVAFGFVATGV